MQAPDAEIISACLIQTRSLGFGEGGEHSHITALGSTPKAVHIQPQPPSPESLEHSLRVQLIQGAVHTHSDPHVLKSLVFSPLLHDGSQASTIKLGRPPGHSAAHLLHHDAVLTRAVQAELLQDPPDLEEGQPVAASKQSRMSRPIAGALEPAPQDSQPPIPRCLSRRRNGPSRGKVGAGCLRS